MNAKAVTSCLRCQGIKEADLLFLSHGNKSHGWFMVGAEDGFKAMERRRRNSGFEVQLEDLVAGVALWVLLAAKRRIRVHPEFLHPECGSEVMRG